MKPRLLVVDHNACRPPQQRPYQILAATFQVRLVIPAAWRESHSVVSASLDSPHRDLSIRALQVKAGGKYHRSWYKGLRGQFAEFRPEIVWLHAEPENVLAWQARRARDAQAPAAPLVLVSWRNIPFERGKLPYRFPWLYQAIEDGSLKADPLILCYNAEAFQYLGGRGFRCRPTRMGVNLDAFGPGAASAARAALGVKLKSPVFGFAGRCLEEKGVSDLIEALALLKRGSLLVLGDGPALPQWTRLAGERGVAMQSMSLPHEKVHTGLQALDCLVLPSRSTSVWIEQFGRVLVEAMACGVPVVGSDSGAIPGVLKGGAGLVFPEGNIGKLTLVLKQSLQANVRSRLKAAGKKRAAHFGWQGVARDLAAVFRAELKRKR